MLLIIVQFCINNNSSVILASEELTKGDFASVRHVSIVQLSEFLCLIEFSLEFP